MSHIVSQRSPMSDIGSRWYAGNQRNLVTFSHRPNRTSGVVRLAGFATHADEIIGLLQRAHRTRLNAAADDLCALLRGHKPDHWPAGTPGGKGGQFKPKDGTGGAAISKVRKALADATSIAEINKAIAGEAKRITGQTTAVNLKGADLQVARETGEGILRGLERSPTTRLTSVTTYGPGAGRASRAHEHDDGFANAHNAKGDTGRTTEMAFNIRWMSDPAAFRAALAKDGEKDNGARGKAYGDAGPMGNAIHEFGHVAASQVPETYERVTYDAFGNVMRKYLVNIEREAGDLVTARVDKLNEGRRRGRRISARDYVAKQVSWYGSWERSELLAEAFADVVVHGDKASSLSKDIYDMVVRGAG